MALYTPIFQTSYFQKALLDTQHFVKLLASGVLDLEALIGYTIMGDYVNVPTMVRIADFIRTDYAGGGQQSATAASADTQKAPILWSNSLNSFLDTDVARTNENISQLWSEGAGEKVAKRALQQFGFMMAGATPTAHTYDVSGQSKRLRVADVLNAKFQAGDIADDFTTLVCHSQVWLSLVSDMLATYSANPTIAGSVFLDGTTSAILGIQNIVLSDQMPVTAAGFGTAGDDIYTSFICKPKAIKFAHEQEMKVSQWTDPTIPGNKTYINWLMGYTMLLEGTQYTGGSNPSDSTLASTGSWTTAYQDAREVGALKLVSLGSKGA